MKINHIISSLFQKAYKIIFGIFFNKVFAKIYIILKA